MYKVPRGTLLEGQLDLIHLKVVLTYTSFQANLQTVSENLISEANNINFYAVLAIWQNMEIYA